MKTIGLACDHAGFELKEYVRGWLEAKGWAYKDFGTNCRTLNIKRSKGDVEL